MIEIIIKVISFNVNTPLPSHFVQLILLPHSAIAVRVLKCVIFPSFHSNYWTRVRSLAMLVTHLLTDSLNSN